MVVKYAIFAITTSVNIQPFALYSKNNAHGELVKPYLLKKFI